MVQLSYLHVYINAMRDDPVIDHPALYQSDLIDLVEANPTNLYVQICWMGIDTSDTEDFAN